MDTARRSGGPWSVVGSNAFQPRMAGCSGRSRVFLTVEGAAVSKVEGHVDVWRSRKGRQHGKEQEGNGDRGTISETERGSERVSTVSQQPGSKTRIRVIHKARNPQNASAPRRRVDGKMVEGARRRRCALVLSPVWKPHFRSWRCRTSSGCCRRRGEQEGCRFCWRSGDSAVGERATSRHGRLRSANHCPEVSFPPAGHRQCRPTFARPPAVLGILNP